MNERFAMLGSGQERVLVLHDFFMNTGSYAPLHNYLDQERFTYAFFDLRGYGKSKTLKGEYTLDEVSRDCLALVDHLEWKKFHAIGHSMTGLTLQHLNALAPERLLSVTAITPVPATGSSIPEAFLAYTRQGIMGDDMIIKEIINSASGNRYSDAFINFKLQQFREAATPEARLGYLQMFSANDISHSVQGIATPYHVIVGKCDTPWHNREIMEKTFGAYYPHCTISEIADASHFPMQETPILLASLIEGFLIKNSC